MKNITAGNSRLDVNLVLMGPVLSMVSSKAQSRQDNGSGDMSGSISPNFNITFVSVLTMTHQYTPVDMLF